MSSSARVPMRNRLLASGLAVTAAVAALGMGAGHAAAAGLDQVRSRGANAPVTAPSHSWYVTATDPGVMAQLGRDDATWDASHCTSAAPDKLVILDWGRPIADAASGNASYGGYGVLTLGGAHLQNDAVVYLTEAYARGYAAAAGGCPRLLLALGTSNNYECSGGALPCDLTVAGAQWAAATADLQRWLTSNHLGGSMRAAAADDMETYGGDGWDCAAGTRLFVDGFNANDALGALLIDYGDAITSEGCWTAADVWYVAFGATHDVALPEAYFAPSLCEWTQCEDSTPGLESLRPLPLLGTMTECQTDELTAEGLCPVEDRLENGPGRASEELRYLQSEAIGGLQAPLRYLTNMRFQTTAQP
jgi:hypothetical protein